MTEPFCHSAPRLVGTKNPRSCLLRFRRLGYICSVALSRRSARCAKMPHLCAFLHIPRHSSNLLKTHGNMRSLAQNTSKKRDKRRKWKSPPRQIRKSWIPAPLGTRKPFWQPRLPFAARRGGLPLPRFETPNRKQSNHSLVSTGLKLYS